MIFLPFVTIRNGLTASFFISSSCNCYTVRRHYLLLCSCAKVCALIHEIYTTFWLILPTPTDHLQTCNYGRSWVKEGDKLIEEGARKCERCGGEPGSGLQM